jgi:hypothetical protein
MLKEEQVLEILLRHHNAIGKHAAMIRGNLRNAETRAAQIWELIVLDATARTGEVEYEPRPGGSPDIRLLVPGGRAVWIEVAYLYPRFWQERRKMDAVVNWIFSEAKRLEVAQFKVFPRFEEYTRTDAGPLLKLPDQHKKRDFLQDPELISFFEHITSNPQKEHRCSLSQYSVSIEYRPNAIGPNRSWSGLVEEAPRTIDEHAVYRVLRAKSSQHDVAGPHIVCVGSDVSPVLSRFCATGRVSVRDAIMASFEGRHSLSAVIVVHMESVSQSLWKWEIRARSEVFHNPHARTPLTSEELSHLQTITFNHWKYTFPLPKKEAPGSSRDMRLYGNLVWRPGKVGSIVEIPAHIVIDALAGKTSLKDQCGSNPNDPILRLFGGEYRVASCSFKDADLEGGEGAKIVLELVPRDSVFRPRKPNTFDSRQPKMEGEGGNHK